MGRVQADSKRGIRLWVGGFILLLLLILIRLFFLNTYYVGIADELPNGMQERSLLLVALQKEPIVSDDLMVVKLYDEAGRKKLVPARLLQRSSVKPNEELLIDIGASDIWILREQVLGKVIAQIKLP